MQTDQIDKQELKDWIDDLNSPKTLQLLQTIKNSQSKGDWWNEIPEAAKYRIKQGAEDIKAGRITPHKEVRKKLRKMAVNHYPVRWTDRAIEDSNSIYNYLTWIRHKKK